jgi:hypothetical protein
LENQCQGLSEEEFGEKIVNCHDVFGYGFMRISSGLKSQGIDISKDGPFRRYHRRKTNKTAAFEEDKELADLNELERLCMH